MSMFKIYSKGCEYAISALTQISLKDSGQSFLAADICRKANLPEHSTRKALQLLVWGGLLESVSGPGGGYKLSRDPRNISLLDIIKSIDGENVFDHCVMGLSECGSKNPCPVHNTWIRVKGKMLAEMQQKSLYELMTIGRKV